MATTRVPEVVDALVAAVRAVVPVTVQVTDGHPQDVADLTADSVYVAAAGIYGPSVEVSQTHDDALCDPMEEGTVHCGLSSWRGDIGMKTVRDRAAVLLALVEGVVRDDRKLGGVVDWCELGGNMVWALAHTDKGSVAEVSFDVRYRAYL